MAIKTDHISGGAIAALVSERKWGGPTRVVPNNLVAVSAARSRIAINNPKRVILVISSLDNCDLEVFPSSGALGTKGILLGRRGGFAIVSADEDGELVCAEWWGYSLNANGNVGVIEVEIV